MPDDFHILPDSECKRAVRGCPLLEGNRGKAWVDCCTRRFLPFARRIVEGDPLAEDILQESWIKIMEAIRHTRLSGPNACPWVHAIVTNTARDVLRKRKHHGEVPLQEVTDLNPDPEALALEREWLVLIRKMIEQLPDTYCQILELRLNQGLPNPEIARRLHLSSDKVAVRLHRGIRLLRQQFDSRIRRLRISPAKKIASNALRQIR